MNIVITGGAGYIGSVLTLALARRYRDCNITIFDKFMYGQRLNFLNDLDEYDTYEQVEVYNLDVTDDTAILRDSLDMADIVIPLAALVGAPLCDKYPTDARRINADWFTWAMNYVNKSAKVIYPNTNSAYGTTLPGTISTERDQLTPISLYGRTKLDAERYLLYNYGYQSVCFRLATVFGLSYRMRLDLLVNNFIYGALVDKKLTIYKNGAEARRNFVALEDVVSAFIFAIENFDKMRGNVYNLGTDELNDTKIGFANTVGEALNVPVAIFDNDIEDQDKRDYVVSNKKLLDTGFRPKVTDMTQAVKNIAAFIEPKLQDQHFLKRSFNYGGP